MHFKTSTWIILIILALGVFAGFKFGPPYIRNMQFNYFLSNEANDSLKMTNEEILSDITKKIEELNLAIDPANVVFIEEKKRGLEDEPYVLIERTKDYISFTSEYQATVHFVGKYETILNFSPDIYYEIPVEK